MFTIKDGKLQPSMSAVLSVEIIKVNDSCSFVVRVPNGPVLSHSTDKDEFSSDLSLIIDDIKKRMDETPAIVESPIS